jgi:hypothetical protein
MNFKMHNKNAFNLLIEKACNGTDVSTRELYREFVNYGYSNFKDLELSLEDLKAIVADISESKESTITHIQTKASRTEVDNPY